MKGKNKYINIRNSLDKNTKKLGQMTYLIFLFYIFIQFSLLSFRKFILIIHLFKLVQNDHFIYPKLTSLIK